jgi:hypothetical protein|uniref:hypothetical protein n=1 Tax=Algoriphagus sp. TaxID=1872435 RepID=UPI0040482AE6
MKNATCLALILFLSFPQAIAQKLDSILSRSNFSFSYGLSHDYHSYDPIPIGTYIELKGRGEAFGFEYLYRPAGKNEYGFGFSKQVNSEDYSFVVQTQTAVVFFEDYRIKKTKNFHYLVIKRHFIEEKLIGSAGLFNLRFRDPYIQISGANSDRTQVSLHDAPINFDFGAFLGLEYYHSLRENFQIGLRTRLFYTSGYSQSFESLEFTPVLRFRLN